MQLYRYLSDENEYEQIQRERKVQTLNPTYGYRTWFTVTRYDDVQQAQEELALPLTPRYRVGPIAVDPDEYALQLEQVQPSFGHPGSGIECSTTEPIWLFGVWSFGDQCWKD
ncbi:MAG: hypothetical protein O3A46_03945 [Candidatus Poribacteria bacterium]|nr:hypothetical protein [Candidatus Poribacteria bacterium]